jgi:4a-hydroxytetrahydrobiopterin dehydratase
VATLLDETLIADTLESLPGWQGDTTRIWRDVHLDAEQDAELRRQIEVDGGSMGHAPTYEEGEGGTRIVLRTEEAGGVTELDVTLASHISDLVHRIKNEEPGIDAHRHDEAIVIFRAGEGGSGDEVPAGEGEDDMGITPGGLMGTRMRGTGGGPYQSGGR